MNRQVTAVALLLGGIFLLALGLAWNRFMPASAYWDEDQAREYAEAQADLHAKSHFQKTNVKLQAEFAAARARYDNISHQLESAQNSRSRTSTLIIAAGILALLSGIGIHLASRPSG